MIYYITKPQFIELVNDYVNDYVIRNELNNAKYNKINHVLGSLRNPLTDSIRISKSLAEKLLSKGIKVTKVRHCKITYKPYGSDKYKYKIYSELSKTSINNFIADLRLNSVRDIKVEYFDEMGTLIIKRLADIKDQLVDSPLKTKEAFNRIIKYFNEGKCPASGCIEQDSEGNWRIISNKTGEYWKQKYKSKESAKAALRAYYVNK